MSIKGFKGFDKNLQCRNFQYEIGKKYEEPEASVCSAGFHFCEEPLDVFNYYPPADSRYCEVEGDGDTDKSDGDSKVSCTHIKIGAEIGLPGLISAGVKFILDRVNWKNNKESNTGDRSAATNTGYQSAATNTGYRSAATATVAQPLIPATVAQPLIPATRAQPPIPATRAQPVLRARNQSQLPQVTRVKPKARLGAGSYWLNGWR